MNRDYPRVWAILEATMPDPERFFAQVDALNADELVMLYADVIDARDEVRCAWEGPFIPELDSHLSEDSTEDLTDWIVGQGYAYWQRAIEAEDAALATMLSESEAERETPSGRWNERTPVIGPAFFNSYAKRFDADVFLDAVDAELKARHG